MPDGPVEVSKCVYMTGLILMGYAIKAATADAVCDVQFFEENVNNTVTAHGVQGKKDVVNFKMRYMEECRKERKVAYRFMDSFTVDLANCCVRLGFDCRIAGSEGTGTQFIYYDQVIIISLYEGPPNTCWLS